MNSYLFRVFLQTVITVVPNFWIILYSQIDFVNLFSKKNDDDDDDDDDGDHEQINGYNN